MFDFLHAQKLELLMAMIVGMRLLHVDDGVYMGGATTEEISLIPVYQFKPIRNNKSTVINPSTISCAISNTVVEDDCHITIDPCKSDYLPHQQKQQKPGIFDKLWLHLGLIDPPCESEPVYDIMEIPDVQDQVCVICLSTYEDGDMLSKLWCKHHFHRACIKEWLMLNRRCPLCKQDFGGKDVLFDV